VAGRARPTTKAPKPVAQRFFDSGVPLQPRFDSEGQARPARLHAVRMCLARQAGRWWRTEPAMVMVKPAARNRRAWRLAEASGFAFDHPGRAGGLEHFPPRPPEAEMKCPLRVGPPLVRAVAGADYVTLGVEEGSNAPPFARVAFYAPRRPPFPPNSGAISARARMWRVPAGRQARGETPDEAEGRRPAEAAMTHAWDGSATCRCLTGTWRRVRYGRSAQRGA